MQNLMGATYFGQFRLWPVLLWPVLLPIENVWFYFGQFYFGQRWANNKIAKKTEKTTLIQNNKKKHREKNTIRDGTKVHGSGRSLGL